MYSNLIYLLLHIYCILYYTDTQVVVIWDERQNLVSENESVEFCVFVWGPLTEPVHLLIETTDHGADQAIGKSGIFLSG